LYALLGRGKATQLERSVYDAVAAAMHDDDGPGHEDDDDDARDASELKSKSKTNVRAVSVEDARAMLTLLGAALKYNGLSYEQGYMYYCGSGSSGASSTAPASQPLAFLSSALQRSGLYSLTRSLLGGVKGPTSATAGYLSRPEHFARLILRSLLDPQVHGACAQRAIPYTQLATHEYAHAHMRAHVT
jgi:hypothetical protein